MKNRNRSKRFSNFTKAEAIKLIMSGQTTRQVAERFGCDHSTVSSWMKLYRGSEKDEVNGLKSKV